jgi:cytochrome b
MLVLAVILLVGASVYAGSQPHRKIALAALATVILAESLVYWLLFAEVIAPLITFIVLHGFGFGIGSLLLRMRESGQKKST